MGGTYKTKEAEDIYKAKKVEDTHKAKEAKITRKAKEVENKFKTPINPKGKPYF